jgi:hypothetical protein
MNEENRKRIETNRNPERQGPPSDDPPPKDEGPGGVQHQSEEPPPESRPGDSGEATPRLPGVAGGAKGRA